MKAVIVCGDRHGRFSDWLRELYELELANFIDTNFDSPLDLMWPLAPALKHALFGLMNADTLSGGQHHSVAYAMERLVQSLRTGMEKGGALALPKLLAWQPHGYE